MKKATKRTLSLLLVVAMIFSLGIMAIADDASKTISVSPSSQTVYAGTATPVAVAATVIGYSVAEGSTPGDMVTWTVDNPYVTVSSDQTNFASSVDTAVGAGGIATVYVKPVDASAVATAQTVTVTATLNKAAGGTKSASSIFTVLPDSISSINILDGSAVVTGKVINVTAGTANAVQLSAAITHMNGSSGTEQVTWSTSNSAAANVSGDGLVTGLGIGSARITALCGAKSAYVDVNVIDSNTAAAPTITSPAGDTTYYVEHSSKTPPVLSVTAVGSGSLSYQWYSKTSSATVYSAVSGSSGKSASHTPDVSSVGTTTYYCTVTNTSGTATAAANSPVFTVNVKDPYEVTVTGSASVNKGAYTTLTAKVMQNTITNYTLSQTAVASGTLNWSVSTLNSSYLSFDSAKALSSKDTLISGGYSSVPVYGRAVNVSGVPVTATFTPATTAYTGSISVKVVTASVNAAATVVTGGDKLGLNATNGYTPTSIQTQLTNGISDLSYIMFDTKSIVGGTYGTFTGKADTKYYVSSWLYDNISDLTFTPGTGVGTYVINYTAYDQYGNPLTVGTISFVVKSPATGVVDVAYNLRANGSVTLDENDFSSWYKSMVGTTYTLTSVKFNSLPAYGTMKNGISTVNTSTDYYTAASAPLAGKTIGGITYTAAKNTGSFAVSFTCTGKASSTGASVTKDGTLYFCVTAGTVGDVSYKTAYTASTSLYESDFTSVYKTATGSTATSPYFTIRFLTVPSKGTLYRAGKTTTGYNISATQGQNYYVNASAASAFDVDDIIYAAGKYDSGSDSALYAAYDVNGVLQYVGTLSFVYGTNTKTIDCYSEGYTFDKSVFVSSSDTDPVSYITFTGISAGGALYRNYANGSGSAVTTTMKFYMNTAVSGGYPISSLTFIPKADAGVDVTITYAGVTKAGKTTSGKLVMAYSTRSSAMKFNDVTASWAVPAVDYASSWGLVTGVGNGSFNPNGTMTRAMLVTILYRMAGSPAVGGVNPFKDVSNGAWYRNAVVWAYNSGYVTGTSKTTFGPNIPISRQDIAVMLWRYEGQQSGNSYALSGYSDASSVSPYAKTAMEWAVTNGIISGSNYRLNPKNSGTRAEVCIMFHRMLTA